MSDASTILVLNVGSSSIKCSVYACEERSPQLRARVHCDIHDEGYRIETTTARGSLDTVEKLWLRADMLPWEDALSAVVGQASDVTGSRVAAVGHRVVHGGQEFFEPVVITLEVLAKLAALEPLAPLHKPHAIAGIRGAMQALPDVLQLACFDTAFHHTCPPAAMRFAIPRHWHDRGIRRYGFHGLSYESIVGMLPAVTGGMPARAIIAHLGAGASLCAVRDGRSIATTMGFTPLDGLMMATRCGSIDPGAVLHLLAREGLSQDEVLRLLSRESGLLGVSGISSDMRVLLASTAVEAAEAVELFCERAVYEIGGLASALGGLDTLVFTAGIGEHAAKIR